jgi:acyl carrier protein
MRGDGGTGTAPTPRAVLNEVLAAATEVFGRPALATDSFFDLGGDSLLALDLTVRVKERLGTEPDLDELLTAETLADFARRISMSMADG